MITTTTTTTATTATAITKPPPPQQQQQRQQQPNDYYKDWTREQLVERLLLLEQGPPPPPFDFNKKSDSSSTPISTTTSHSDDAILGKERVISSQNQDQDQDRGEKANKKEKEKKEKKEFNFSKHAKRKIALKFCYSGWEYCGLAFQGVGMMSGGGGGGVPSVEGVLFEAMVKARLIDFEGGMEGCGWEKCGRTDRGVSAAGQVISLWVRSAIGQGGNGEKEEGVAEKRVENSAESVSSSLPSELEGLPGLDETVLETPSLPLQTKVSKPQHELDYIAILNRILPPTIRILAWSPVSSEFSARFSCKYRHYKYFFSPHNLDISRMKEASSRLVGEHDFRNLCKVDAQKQITRFKRIIIRAYIEPVEAEERRENGMYVFNLIGSAFLYHQVRHIMAVLFLIGTGLEKPSLVTRLMNVEEGSETPREGDLAIGQQQTLEMIDRKPEYQMADALPLMLWDCGYAEECVKWRTGTIEPVGTRSDDIDGRTTTRSGTETDLHRQLHSIWNRSRIYTTLNQHFLYAAGKYHTARPTSPLPLVVKPQEEGPFNYPLGGGTYKRVQKYVPVLERNRNDTVDAINTRWRLGKGSRRAERKGHVRGNTSDNDDCDEGNE